MPELLGARKLGKRYGSRWILRDIDLSLGPGDRLAILGQNGSGKSTLLRLLAGLLSPSAGDVSVDGDRRLTMGYSALEQSLYPHLSVAEHLRLAADLRGCEAREAELLDRVGLAKAARVMASELSTGMKARLKLAMAIQARPAILLLDEPGASLDEVGRALIETVAEEQTSRGCLVFATNDPRERRMANLELRLED